MWHVHCMHNDNVMHHAMHRAMHHVHAPRARIVKYPLEYHLQDGEAVAHSFRAPTWPRLVGPRLGGIGMLEAQADETKLGLSERRLGGAPELHCAPGAAINKPCTGA